MKVKLQVRSYEREISLHHPVQACEACILCGLQDVKNKLHHQHLVVKARTIRVVLQLLGPDNRPEDL